MGSLETYTLPLEKLKKSIFPNMQKKKKTHNIESLGSCKMLSFPKSQSLWWLLQGSLKYGYPAIHGIYIKPWSVNTAQENPLLKKKPRSQKRQEIIDVYTYKHSRKKINK